MARVWIGNFKGPKGDKGEKGDMGPQGPQGEQGPMGLVNAGGLIEFDDYTEEGAEIPSTKEALAGIKSGSSLKDVISNIKAFCKGVVTLGMVVDNLEDVLAVKDDKIPVGCKAIQGLNAKTLKYIDVPTGKVVLNNLGYATLTPPGTRPYLFATITNWTVESAAGISAFSIVGKDRSFYINGSPSTTINGLQVRYWYTE